MFAARQIEYQKELGHRYSISKNKEAHVTSQEMKKKQTIQPTTVLDFQHHQ
jgi:hypothetical protein